MEKLYLFNVYTFYKSLYVIEISLSVWGTGCMGSPYGLPWVPHGYTYLDDQMWLVGYKNLSLNIVRLFLT